MEEKAQKSGDSEAQETLVDGGVKSKAQKSGDGI